MYTLATLHNLREHLGMDAGVDDMRLLATLQAASAAVERHANRRFAPYQATIEHTITNPYALFLDADLRELETLTTDDGRTYTNYTRIGDGVIRLTDAETFTYADTPVNAASVRGIWGWHDRSAVMWRDSGDTVGDDPLSISATSITVTDTDGADAANEIPRFQVGQLLRISSEYLWVLGVEASTNTLTVNRGANGTSPAGHTQSTRIDVYQPPADLRMLVIRWAAWLYKTPDHDPAAPPAPFMAVLRGLRRERV